MKIFNLYLLIFFTACNILPNNYSEQIIGKWTSLEKINTPTGEATITYTATFTKDQQYTVNIIHPITGQITRNFIYKIGYYPPHPAFIFLDLVTKEPLSVPNFFYFSNNFTILVTSTNANMLLSRIWKK